MPIAHIAPDLDMYYVVDDYTDPWQRPETMLLLHGSSESGDAWLRWVPHLARRFRVVRPDMRGFGKSTPMAAAYPWRLDDVVDDFAMLMQQLGIERFHLVGAKIAATIARRFAGRFPERITTLTLVGSPPPRRDHQPGVLKQWLTLIEKEGVEAWAKSTMAGRLGSAFPEGGVAWWSKLMGRTPRSTALGFVATIPGWDVSDDLARIACPTLVLTTEESGLGSVDAVRKWQAKIRNSTLISLPGNSFHIAATDPDRCAKLVLDFIARHASASGRAPGLRS